MTRITSMIGFQETATFSKFFRKLMGVTPSDYRERPRKPRTKR
jgi:AraC-like DNA-binding protein